MRAVANSYVDDILTTVDNYVEQNSYQQIDIPDINAGFSKKASKFKFDYTLPSYIPQSRGRLSYFFF